MRSNASGRLDCGTLHCLAVLTACLTWAGACTALAQVTVIGSTATSNQSTGSGNSPAQLTSSSQTIRNTMAQPRTLTLQVSDTNFNFPTDRPLTLTSLASGTFVPVAGTDATSVAGASIRIQTFGDATNAVFGMTFPAQDFTFTAPDRPSASFSDLVSRLGFNPAGAYSLTIQVRLTLPGHVELNNRSNTLTAEAGVLGDFNNDGDVDATDIDLLCNVIDSGGGSEPFDLNNDGDVTEADLAFEIEEILNTKFGDTDTDGDVDLSDLGNVASGFNQPGEKRWSRGNFDCDNDVDLNDLGTLATNFQAGRAAAYAEFPARMPEPSAGLLLLIAGPAILRRRWWRDHGSP
jgi:hypothetical protein